MKTLFKTFLLVITFLTLTNSNAQSEHDKHNYFQISPRIGYDFPTYNNNTPYIDYKGGLEAGISLDYYWKWFGIGADFDYIKNKPENTYPTTNVIGRLGPITTFNLNEDKITRIFYGIGPSFKHENQQGNFVGELNLRAGLASIKGGRTILTDAATNDLLNFHTGYNAKNVFSSKAQVRFTYFFKETIGVQAGAYYLRHFNVTEQLDKSMGITSGYQPFTSIDGQNVLDQSGLIVIDEVEKNTISSVGVFAGLTFKFPSKKDNCKACDTYSLAVTAKDKFTSEVLPNTDVVVKDTKGNVVQTGTTNSYGVVVFNNINADNYVINGQLYTVALQGNSASENEFKPNETLQKEILYTDSNFILKGNAVECNTITPLQNVSVILKDVANALQKNTLTDTKGAFIFHLKQKSEFTIYGKKANFFSQTETISTNSFDRNTTLFVQLEVCMEEADCGKAIALKNIHYDVDKYTIRNDAKPELNRLVQFMLDNPQVNVEVSSHTDSRATNSYNQTLSQNRANAAVDYLVSQGISRSRLTGKGYGETMLLNKCADNVECSEADHQINRRTEMKVVCPK
ncbi:OmpA family protein [uncultured Lutibacter sp.]|uniref:OmpA family protein n=1 Tax=uncultured Lutibacter sp. TaxID=437739 RepID=UPI002629C4EC|nr:OmpA family protein [uncultured Lutibacter sp.]